MIIEATQFHRPHGEQEIITGVVDDALAPQWAAIQATGLRLEMEIVSSTTVPNLVSITLTDSERSDYKIHVVPNDVNLLKVVEKMIRTFDVEDLAAWRMEWDAHETDDPANLIAPAELTATVMPAEQFDALATDDDADARNDEFMLSIDGDE